MSTRYDHLQSHIEAFFEKRGRKVVIEPRGSGGPDFEDVPFLDVVGEIKHAGELARDLKGYWSQWNSSQRFGGKSYEYRLREEFDSEVDRLSAVQPSECNSSTQTGGNREKRRNERHTSC